MTEQWCTAATSGAAAVPALATNNSNALTPPASPVAAKSEDQASPPPQPQPQPQPQPPPPPQPTSAAGAPLELKARRIKVLRVLSIKAAAILDWDLTTFEKELALCSKIHEKVLRP
jgi:hypothetical protein